MWFPSETGQHWLVQRGKIQDWWTGRWELSTSPEFLVHFCQKLAISCQILSVICPTTRRNYPFNHSLVTLSLLARYLLVPLRFALPCQLLPTSAISCHFLTFTLPFPYLSLTIPLPFPYHFLQVESISKATNIATHCRNELQVSSDDAHRRCSPKNLTLIIERTKKQIENIALCSGWGY